MTDTTAHPFAQRLSQAPDSRLLRADQNTGADLMCMPEIEEQTEHYLAIEHGDSADRGMLTGALGGEGVFGVAIAPSAYADRDMDWVLNTIRIVLFICAFSVISGCVGVGAIAPADSYAYLNSKTAQRSIFLDYDSEQKNRTVNHGYNGGGPDKRYSVEEVRRAWGAPDEVTTNEPYTVWTYHEPTLRWSGMALHALVTIPLAIPTGKEKYTLYFNGDELEKIQHHTFSTKLFVCDPAYMLVGGMAAGMSPTGRGSVPGLCSVIEREGMYFHYLMNY
ncbi:hypothetical protein HP532_15030 [Pseudomonas sp. CrR25]|nr:hypothetical protein [Pseudomonas sp. CrR25]